MWSEILVNYGVFVLKIITVLLVIGGIAAVIFNLKQRREGSLGELQINDLSEEYKENSKKLRDFHLSEEAFKQAEDSEGCPTAIILKTVKGKGVSFMENQVGWHGTAPNDEQYEIAMKELEEAGEALCQK